METLLQTILELKLQVDAPEAHWDRGIIIGKHIHQNGRTIAKYIFALCDVDSFRANMLADGTPVQRLVEDLFYELRDDLGWNLYLVCVMEPDQFNRLSLHERLQFENNREFTRNLVIPTDRLKKEIPVGRVLMDNIDKAIENPITIWNQNLADLELSFCLEDYSNATIQNYIEGKTTVHSGGRGSVSAPNIPIIKQIDSLNLSKAYRPHCFGDDKTLEFTRVNLLSGANGTGKTSILQAIELVLTGEIRTGKGNPSMEEAGSSLSIEYNGGDTLAIPTDREEKRKRESSWYLNRDATSTKPALNNVFHVYNTFTVEDTFLFSFDGLQPAYEDFFTKMLFGEEVKRAEYCWRKCRENFAGKLKELQSQERQNNEKLTDMLSPNSISRETIIQYLDKLSIRYDPQASIADIRNMVIELQTRCDSVTFLSPIATRKQLEDARKAWRELQESLTDELDDLEEKRRAIVRSLDQERAHLEEAATIQSQINQEKAIYHYALTQYDSLQFIAIQYDLLMKLCEKKAALKKAQAQANLFKPFLLRYEKLASCKVDLSELAAASKKLEQIRPIIQQRQEVVEDCRRRISNLQSEKKGLENTVEQLKIYGKLYLESVKDFHGCPLCGNQAITLEDFRDHLHQQADEMDQELLAAHQALREAERNLVALLSEAQSLENAVEQLRLINEAFDACIQTLGVVPAQDNNKLSTIQATIVEGNKHQDIYTVLHEEVRTFDAGLRDTVPEMLLPVYDSGAYEEMVGRVEHNMNLAEAEQKPLNERIADLLGILRAKQDDWNSRGPLADNRVRELTASVKTADEQLKKLQEQLQNIHTQITTQNKYGQEYEKIHLFFNSVAPLLREDVKEIDARALSRQCESLISSMNLFLQQQQNISQIERLKGEQENLAQKIKRAQNAIAQLDRLTESHVFAQNFIEHHINRISEIFGSLHMPREFDRLTLHKKQIVGMRKSTPVAIQHMSTGQKTAVALSVFLTLNSAMKTAPQFILIDEPVSNIDDLNILSLLDLLREMVISHEKQIFFTTANYNVRKLFRRKFSFLEHEMCEYCFERSKNLKASIAVKQYNQREIMEEKVVDFTA